METVTVVTHLVIAVIAGLPAVLAGIAAVLVSLRQLREACRLNTHVNGRLDELIRAREETARLQERMRHLTARPGEGKPPAGNADKGEGR